MAKNRALNILVVDDEEEICTIFNKYLSLDGHKVKYVLTGKKAINLVKKEIFDIVFLDILMPGISGIDTLEKIIKIQSGAKFVIITGKLVDDYLLNDLRQKGASEVLQKPFKINDITETINNLA